MTVRFVAAVTALLLGVSTAAFSQEAPEAFAEHLIHQLTCKHAPDPTATLLYLNKSKRINLDRGEGADSETCWAIRPQLEVKGATFTHICASAEDRLLLDLFPRLYWRGPGTSAGTGLRLVSGEDTATIKDWIKRTITADETKLEVGEPTFVDGRTEISCNSLSFPYQ
ncbi:hypothetical protein [Mesorhizobium sp.]|uniref:hypothetical protein n=1 Tax=Mesorhizobium sp. TaxID=1871066 RepID=UPI000FE5E95A|nr:hypothetical protein [Mesorhizobium sp.]RWK37903.1 MAG: hypothetical protein EOR46_25115 [Mesorhizobium sp.]